MHIKNDPPAPNQNANLFLNPVAQSSKAKPVSKDSEADGTKKQAVLPQDKVTLSKQAVDINTIKKAVTEASDVREAKVIELKTAVENGTYNVTGKQIAEKILGQSSTFDIII